MFSKKIVQFGLMSLIFTVLIPLKSPDSFAAEKKALTWGTTATTSGAFSYFVIAARILNESIPEVNISVRSTGASVHNTRLLEKREIDIGGIDTTTAGQAFLGQGVFEGKAFKDLRLLYAIHPMNPFQFVVSEKSDVKDIYGLEGKPFTPGMLGSGAERISAAIFRILGIRPILRHSSYADAIEAMKNEMIVGFGKLGAPDASILNIMSVMKIRILSLNDGDIEKIVDALPGMMETVVPAGTYAGISDFKTIENQWCVFVRKDFPSEWAFKVVRTHWEKRAEIKKSYPNFVGDKLAEVTLKPKKGIYLHSGAAKFYRELGQTVPQSLITKE